MPKAARVAIVALLAVSAAGCARRDGIQVLRATYGASCGQPAGNVTLAVAERCDGRAACDLPVAPAALTDPAEGCEKDFEVLWACRSGQAGARRIYLPKQATLGARAQLACE